MKKLLLAMLLLSSPLAADDFIRFTVKDGLMYSDAEVNGVKFEALIDSGAASVVIDERAFSGVRCISRVTLKGAAGNINACWASANVKVGQRLTSGGIVKAPLQNGVKLVIPLNRLGRVVKIDYDSSIIEVIQ
jgi:hypothetical protein